MITLTRLHGAGTLVVNADLVETLEATPDTVVTLVTKRRFVVQEPVQDVVRQVIEYRRACAERLPGPVRATSILDAQSEPRQEAA